MIGELAALEQMPTPALKDRWRALVGTEPPAYSRLGLIRRLAVVIQRLKYGGLPKSVEDRLDQVLIDRGINPEDGSTFKHSTNRNRPHRLRPPVGSRFSREWNGKTYTLTFLEEGVDMNGTLFNSPTHAARVITGGPRSGYKFFGIQ